MDTTWRTRIRVNHSHTLKEGWRASETTVEVEFSGPASIGDKDEALLRLTELSREAHGVAEAEAERRRSLPVAA